MPQSDREFIMQVHAPHTIPPSLTPDQFTAELVEHWITRCAELGVTTIFWHVNYAGKATFHSSVMSQMTPLTPQYYWERGIGSGTVPAELFTRIAACLDKFDTLDVALAAAEKHGIALYAYLDLFDQYFPGLENTFFDENPELWLRGRVRRRPSQMYNATIPEAYQRMAYDEKESAQPGHTWYRGIPSYAELATQEHWLAFIKELIGRGVNGFAYNFLSHAQSGFGNTWGVIDGNEGPDSFGFNPPVVDEYRKRYGVNILTEPFESTKLCDLQGEFFTKFLRRIRETIGPDRNLIAGTTLDGVCGYGVDGAQFRMTLNWRQWIDEAIADGLMVYSQNKTPPDIEQAADLLKHKLDQGRVFVWRNIEGSTLNPGYNPEQFADYCRQMDRACTNAIDGYGIKELAKIGLPVEA